MLWMRSGLLTCSLLACLGLGCTTEQEALPGDDERVGEAQQAILTDCPWTSPTINFERELIIRDVAVVDDQCRTGWDPTKCVGYNAASVGKWTFKKLITEMAGDNDPQEFVGRWLSLWESNQTNINGFATVQKRTEIRKNLIDPWIKASPGINCGQPNVGINKAIYGSNSCPLDLTKAPFRLLAIVPRLDSSTALNWGLPPDPNQPGELRFVFGALNLDELLNTYGGSRQATVIFEYKFTAAKVLLDWAETIHDLGGYAPGAYTSDSTYKTKLEAITTLVTKKQALASGNNYGNAIAQIRTNEIDWNPNPLNLPAKVWEFREHKLTNCTLGTNKCFLAMAPVAQTPDNSLNRTLPLDNYLVANEANILTETNTLPPNFASLVSFSGSGPVGNTNEAIRWSASDALPGYNSLARHHLGFATCNGCHYSETGIDRTHIKTRKRLFKSALSGFLGVNNATDPLAPDPIDPALPAAVFEVEDPVSAEPRQYNEPWRRACELKRILNHVATPWSKATGAH